MSTEGTERQTHLLSTLVPELSLDLCTSRPATDMGHAVGVRLLDARLRDTAGPRRVMLNQPVAICRRILSTEMRAF